MDEDPNFDTRTQMSVAAHSGKSFVWLGDRKTGASDSWSVFFYAKKEPQQ
ncbi:hypothetical protein [Paenibacillus luteus]|nr:hypothetical protein [Paenibacillus luteus]